MHRMILAAAAVVFALTASTVARADFAIVRFPDGNCQIWWDSAANPWGAGWSKIAIGLPNGEAARVVLNNAIVQNACR